MKIKIIEILNKIANEEEVPEKIKYEGQEYELAMSRDYRDFNSDVYLFENIFIGKNINYILNDKVEIIEELKDIEIDKKTHRRPDNDEIINKINELVKEINKLKENK